ncbi:MAG: V-type ATP synthase subunit E family protein [bacterium]|nr:V-type ATP synthase subunit E family protein [bacterium]
MTGALDPVRAAVLAEAEAEAARIAAEARAQLDRLLAEGRREDEERARVRLEEERAAIEGEAMREVARARREARMALLAARNRVLDEVMKGAREELLRTSPERYGAMLRRWIEGIDAPEGGEIVPGAEDAEVVAEIAGDLNRERPAGRRLSVSAERAPFERGFLFRTARFGVERSLDGWLEERKRERIPALDRELFGDLSDVSDAGPR